MYLTRPLFKDFIQSEESTRYSSIQARRVYEDDGAITYVAFFF